MQLAMPPLPRNKCGGLCVLIASGEAGDSFIICLVALLIFFKA